MSYEQMVQISWWNKSTWNKSLPGRPHENYLDSTSPKEKLSSIDRYASVLRSDFFVGCFSGLLFQIAPATFRSISKRFTLDEGTCLWLEELHCPGGGGEKAVGVLLLVCLCTHSVISARRPEEPRPAGLRQEAEDFRATDSGILAMRFDASIHWPETLDLNGAAWLCPCLA